MVCTLPTESRAQTIEDNFMTETLTSHTAATPARSVEAKAKKALPVQPKSVTWNPSPADFRRLTEEMPNCRKTEFGNVNVGTRVVSRSKGSTYVVTDTPENHSDQTISRAEYDRISKPQNYYIKTRDRLAVEGLIGTAPGLRTPPRLAF